MASVLCHQTFVIDGSRGFFSPINNEWRRQVRLSWFIVDDSLTSKARSTGKEEKRKEKKGDAEKREMTGKERERGLSEREERESCWIWGGRREKKKK